MLLLGSGCVGVVVNENPTPARPLPAGLAYVGVPDANFRWVVTSRSAAAGGQRYELDMTSQVWRGMLWRHRISLVKPTGKRPSTALLILRPGNMGEFRGELEWFAAQTGTPCAVLSGVPNEPLFGRTEDDLMGFTLEQFLASGEADWPLSLPMLKSVRRAIDALQSLSQAEFGARIERFVIAGHSKRGGTAWLSAVVDTRVAGIVAVGYELVNIPAQIAHLQVCWPDAMQRNASYRSVANRLSSPRGKQLVANLDPANYADRLGLPKLVAIGTRDEFVPLDSLNLYVSRLPGPTWPLFIYGAAHAQEESDIRLWRAMATLVRSLAAGHKMAGVDWSWQPAGTGFRLSVTAEQASRVILWEAVSGSFDFRGSQWHGRVLTPVVGAKHSFETTVPAPQRGFSMAYAEIELADQPTAGVANSTASPASWCTTPCVVPLSAAGR